MRGRGKKSASWEILVGLTCRLRALPRASHNLQTARPWVSAPKGSPQLLSPQGTAGWADSSLGAVIGCLRPPRPGTPASITSLPGLEADFCWPGRSPFSFLCFSVQVTILCQDVLLPLVLTSSPQMAWGLCCKCGLFMSLGQVGIVGLLPLCPIWGVNGTVGTQGVPGSQGLIHLPSLAKAHGAHCPLDL